MTFRRQFCSLITDELEDISSQLAKQIWKCSKRSIRSPEVWSNFSKQIVSNSAYLTPRDVSVVVQSFARISYRDDKMLSSIVPVILKHAHEFSVRELVTILSSFRKLEIEKSRTIPASCIHLIVNEITIRASEWTAIDVPLIANSVAWFSIFENSVWKKIEKKTLSLIREISPLGLSLIVTSLAKLDFRNERILGAVSRAFTKPSESSESARQEPMKQESLATLINGFGKLDWNPRGLSEYIESELIQILTSQVGASFFDTQSKILVLHALFAHRFRYLEETLTENQVAIFEILTDGVVESKEELNSDQIEKLSQVVAILDGRYSEIQTSAKRLKSLVLPEGKGSSRYPVKLPRWEYEVFRVLRDKMHAKVKKIKIGNSGVVLIDSVDNGVVIVNCLGPFQHYLGSTKRTSASWIRKESIEWKLRQEGRKDLKFIEIPFYLWNELKSDKDKIMFLMARGRQAANGEDQVS